MNNPLYLRYVVIHGLEDYTWTAREFIKTLLSGNLYGASLECTATIGNETKTFREWREDENVIEKLKMKLD
jgi:hypothetical protein